jgi:DNA-binding MarR family transcriptional regulator
MNDEDLYTTALEIRILAGILAKIAGRSLEQRFHAHGIPISSLQHGVMRLLCQHSYTSSELSRKMHLDPATLVPVVDALERHGYVQRGKDASDRRRTPLLLTDEGADLLARVPVFDRDDATIVALTCLGDAQARQLLLLLRELVNCMLPQTDILRDTESIAQAARELFRSQAQACDAAQAQAGDEEASLKHGDS